MSAETGKSGIHLAILVNSPTALWPLGEKLYIYRLINLIMTGQQAVSISKQCTVCIRI